MLSNQMQAAMNEQIKNEFYSAYAYLAMSAYFEACSLPGFAHWMRLQAQEEVEHAMKFFDFLHDRGARETLQAIEQPPTEFETSLEVFERALAHEQKVTRMINDLYALATKDEDFATQAFLNWFVTEQVEEEKNATSVVDTLKMIGDRGEALFLLDRELAQRQAEE
ncbi:MAG TPA: ferritin [Ardenticatenaceae bacterium]|nr:ferritin [Ardenticatenaceae bacterium]